MPRPLLHPLLLRLAALLLAACGGQAPPPEPAPSTNLLLVVIDTLGAEHLGCYRPGLAHSPNLDRLAAHGVLFRRAFSPAPWTQPAVASLLTSRMPSSHGVLRLRERLDGRWPTLGELLANRGFATAGVVSHSLVGAAYGFDRGFAWFDESAVGTPRDATGRRATEAAVAWLERRPRDRPFFLLVHYFDPHYPYLHHPQHDLTAGYQGSLRPGMGIWELLDARPRLGPPDLEYLTGLYREEIAATDAEVGRLLARLAELGLAESTLVVVTADHGEELMRHGWIGHTRTLYDELLHVPLIVSLPGRLQPGVIEAPVSLLDLAPTLVELAAGGPARGDFEGASLAPLLAGASPAALDSRPLFAEVSFLPRPDEPSHLHQKAAFKTALLVGDLKLIHDLATGGWELYDRRRDPEELDDLYGLTPEDERAALARRLLHWERLRPVPGPAAAAGPVASREELDRLKALGYLP